MEPGAILFIGWSLLCAYAGYRLGKWRVYRGMADLSPTDKQRAYITSLSREVGIDPPEVDTRARASLLIDTLLQVKEERG